MFRRVPTLFAVVLVLAISALRQASADDPGSRFAPFGDGRLHYLDFGSNDRVLVFVHGWACDATFWKEQIPAFRNRLRVLAIDLPGHGRSDAPDIDYTMETMARGVIAVLDHARVKKPVLAVHSMGLAVARQTIRMAPGRLSGVVVVDGAYVPDAEIDLEGYEEARASANGLSESLATARRADVIAEFLAPMYGPKASDQLRAWIASRVMATPTHVAASAMRHFPDRLNWREAEVFEGPALAIYAVGPELPPGNVDVLRTWFENLRYVEWSGVGHFLMLEKPALVNGMIGAFLSDIGW